MKVSEKTLDKLPFMVIKPRKGLQSINFRELYNYRDLLFFLVARNIKVKYKQTVLGGLWAVIQPFFMMVVFSLFFGKLAKIPSDGIPYPIFNFTAMIAWTYFSSAINQSGNSVVAESNLISKVYFPRLIIPVTPVVSGLLDYFIAFIFLLLMMLYFSITPTITLLLCPLLVLIMLMTILGVGMILSALNAKYRDIQYTIPLLMQLWMFASPVIYPSSMIPEKYRLIYSLNPMCGIIEGFRSAILGRTPFPWTMVGISAIASILMFFIGVQYFKQSERYFADII